MEAPFK